MAAAVLPVPFFVSGHQVLLVSDAQAVLRPMAPAGQHRGHQSCWHGRTAVSSRALPDSHRLALCLGVR